ncbi:glycoside hydrolase family 85 protein [Sphaerobolus stellatus SS14]|uniref:Glycoside hydrolase family 85 protein n=1 Tax=Sphaerobolus stellatus (strain SS14) TaxID=990650 RepID=A0A0C9UPV9_SPHS4|nr:glycoside hydrolase family 85 protein [Sphaerobolus stellatus SS14]
MPLRPLYHGLLHELKNPIASTFLKPDYIDSIEELLSWIPHRGEDSDLKAIYDLTHTQSDALNEDDHTPFEPEPERKKHSKLLVCHDFKGGYTEDPFSRGYSFEYWKLLFPPQGWFLAVGGPGSKFLGLFSFLYFWFLVFGLFCFNRIFEWEESKTDLCKCLYQGHLYHPGPSDTIGTAVLPFSTSSAFQLMKLAKERRFDGYLLNIETDLNFLPPAECYPGGAQEREEDAEFFRKEKEAFGAPRCLPAEIKDRQERRMKRNALALCNWTKWFTEVGKKIVGPHWEVIWYDSVTMEGKLQWQDALTLANAPFFMNSHGIFTNYTWARPPDPTPPGGLESISHPKPKYHPSLLYSSQLAKTLKRSPVDVYAGIDVFGRNCYGGFEIGSSLDMIFPHLGQALTSTDTEQEEPEEESAADLGLSVALFAPGWSWEREKEGGGERSWDEWWEGDQRLWVGDPSLQPSILAKERAISFYFGYQRYSTNALSETPNDIRVPPFFYTNFCLGSGNSWWSNGRKVFESLLTGDAEDPLGRAGWTDIGVTFPKPDRIWPHPHLLAASSAKRVSEPITSLQSLHQEAPQAGSLDLTLLTKDDVWQGNTSLEIVFSHNSREYSAISERFIPLCTLSASYLSISGAGEYSLEIVIKFPSVLQDNVIVNAYPAIIWASEGSNEACSFSVLADSGQTKILTKLDNDWIRVTTHFSAEEVKNIIYSQDGRVPVLAMGFTIPILPSVHTAIHILVGEIQINPILPTAGKSPTVAGELRWATLDAPKNSPKSLLWGLLTLNSKDTASPGYFDVFVSVTTDIERKSPLLQWLGTTTYNSHNAFVVAGLDTGKLMESWTSDVKELTFHFMPVGHFMNNIPCSVRVEL